MLRSCQWTVYRMPSLVSYKCISIFMWLLNLHAPAVIIISSSRGAGHQCAFQDVFGEPCFISLLNPCISNTFLLANSERMGSHSEPGVSSPSLVLKGWRWTMWSPWCQPRAEHCSCCTLDCLAGKILAMRFSIPEAVPELAGSQFERKQRHVSIRFTPVT